MNRKCNSVPCLACGLFIANRTEFIIDYALLEFKFSNILIIKIILYFRRIYKLFSKQ